jgi:hypothetical protein
VFSQETHPSTSSEYYPLALGNSWKYQVRTTKNTNISTVIWRVTSADKTKEGIIYQVWPTPSDSDDEAMMLHMSTLGLEETSSGVLIPKSPIRAGERWTSAKSTHHRKFHVLSVGQPCQVGSISSENCITVEDEDDALRFRTITTYAKGIGPIRYEYYRKNAPVVRPIQIVELLSYQLY